MEKNILTSEEMKRYRGHISLCEIDLSGQMALRRSRVLIVGTGGLGSAVALYLAAAGVGTLGLVDADRVSLGNLQRQIMHGTPDVGMPKVESARRALERLNPAVNIVTYETMLTGENAPGLLESFDVVIDCTDRFETRLLISDMCVAMGKPFVFGGVMRMAGQVFTHLPGSADFRTFFGDISPEASEPCEIVGILNSVVGVIGTLQATEAIKYIVGTGDLLVNRLLLFDAATMQMEILHVVPPRPQGA